MGVFGAINTAVSGLRAQAFALENISGNIANSQTIGFKRQDTAFSELVSDSGSTQATQNAGSVSVQSRATNDIQGNIIGSEQQTFIAINGDGYFAVQQATGFTNGVPDFEGTPVFTRAGDFQLSNGNFLQNGAGFFLSGTDLLAGADPSDIPQPINISTLALAPESTSEIQFSGNLPINPITDAAPDGDPIAGLLDPTLRVPDGATPPAPTAFGLDTITQADEAVFVNSTLSGGSTTATDSRGSLFNVEFRFAKTDSADPAVGGTDTYNLYYRTASDAANPTDPVFIRVDQQYSFGANGELAPPSVPVIIPNLTIDGNLVGDVTIDSGTSDFTQVEVPGRSGQATSLTINANGQTRGEFDGVSVSDGGLVTVSYSNGTTLDVAQIAVATFENDSGLRRIDGGGTFAQTSASGGPTFNSGSAGFIDGGALEASNTDIADEFTKLIVTQQAYTANSRVITTSDELLTETINIIR